MPGARGMRLTYLPVLDGLRAVAVMMVFLRHYMEDIFPGGILGVDVFFVLSGFLITSLLLEEYRTTARVRLGHFYARRALRLYPALLLLLLVFAVGGIPHTHDATRGIIVGVTYTANWAYAFTTHLPAELAHLWSLAEEEQFYLVWPVLLLAMVARRWSHARVAKALLVSLGLAVGWRTLLWSAGASTYRVFFAFDTHADGLLVGCLLGVCLAGGFATSLFKPGPRAVCYAAVSAATLAVLTFFPRHGIVPTLTTPVFAVCGAGLLCGAYAYRAGVFGRILTLPPLLWLGRRSYAFYLWHLPIKFLVDDRMQQLSARFKVTAGFVLTLVAAEVSWRVVEVPILRLKRRFEVPGVSPTRPLPDSAAA